LRVDFGMRWRGVPGFAKENQPEEATLLVDLPILHDDPAGVRERAFDPIVVRIRFGIGARWRLDSLRERRRYEGEQADEG
jgi:hypothetical protein